MAGIIEWRPDSHGGELTVRTTGFVALAAVTFGVVACRAGTTSSETGPAMRVDRFLDRMAEYGYGGAIGVAAGDSTVLAHGFGLADRERGLPAEAATRFDIGSLTKPFVAAAILRLSEDGALSPADSLGHHLADVPPDKAGISLHQLLTHTSGLVRSAASLGVGDDTPRDEFVAAVLGSELLSEPGERFMYSDTGYDLLAAIAEIATGTSFDLLLDSLVLVPVGAEWTGYADQAGRGPVAPSYSSAFGAPWAEDRDGPSAATWYNRGSGGLVSTVGDLLRFERGVRTGQLLSQASLEQAWTAQVPVDAGRSYGYGWFIESSVRGPVIYHGGDIAGYKAHLARYPDRDVTIAVLDNVFGWERVTDRDAIDAWFGDAPELPLPPKTTGADRYGRDGDLGDYGELDGIEGTYRTTGGDPLVVWPEAGRLAVEAAGQETVNLVFATADDEPAARTADARQVIDALEAGDTAAISAWMRDRDRERGLAARFVSYWALLEGRDGEVVGTRILGSHPAQDGTLVSIVEIERAARADTTTREIFRLIWRGDRFVSAGGDEGLRRPTALFEVTGERTAARYAVESRKATTLRFEGNELHASMGGRTLTAVRDTVTPIDLPPRSIVRALVPIFLSEGQTAGLARLTRLREEAAGRYDTGEIAVNDLGYALLHAAATDEAIAVFQRNVADYPDSWNTHDSLGEALLAAERTEEARRSYARSLELNPDNERAREIVDGSGDAD